MIKKVLSFFIIIFTLAFLSSCASGVEEENLWK